MTEDDVLQHTTDKGDDDDDDVDDDEHEKNIERIPILQQHPTIRIRTYAYSESTAKNRRTESTFDVLTLFTYTRRLELPTFMCSSLCLCVCVSRYYCYRRKLDVLFVTDE